MAKLIIEFNNNGIFKTWSKQYNFYCYCIPRESVSSVIPGCETKNSVYFLINSKQGWDKKRNLYIGETRNGSARLFGHKLKKDFWDKAFVFTSNKEIFEEGTILGLENYLITKYKNSNLYIMEQVNSQGHIDDDCVLFGDQIIGIMDFYGYPTEIQNKKINLQLEKVNNTTSKEKTLKVVSNIFKQLDVKIRSLSSHINSDELKLYTAYKINNKNICAVWQYNYGLEIEFYATIDNIKNVNSMAYDISNRKRGNKKAAMKVIKEGDLNVAIDTVKYILSFYSAEI